MSIMVNLSKNKLNFKNFFGEEVKLFKPKIFKDNRGCFLELYNKNNFKDIKIKDDFVQDNISFSKKIGTIRGLHFQSPPYNQSKIIRVSRGKIQDIVVDLRKNSPTYGKYKSFIISDSKFEILYIPKHFAHGFCTLVNNTEVIYKVSKYYSVKNEKTILWNDKTLSIKWKIKNIKPIVSKKDSYGINFENFDSPF